MRQVIATATALTLAAGPALAAEGDFFTLANTDFVVLIAFLVLLAILLFYNVPGRVTKMLDDRAGNIRSELDEARAIRDEAQSLLASYERKQKEVQAQADRIVANAKDEAARAAEQAKDEIRRSVDKRIAGAENQIEGARAAAVKDIRERAIAVAVDAAREVVRQQMTQEQREQLVDHSIDEVGTRLH